MAEDPNKVKTSLAVQLSIAGQPAVRLSQDANALRTLQISNMLLPQGASITVTPGTPITLLMVGATGVTPPPPEDKKQPAPDPAPQYPDGLTFQVTPAPKDAQPKPLKGPLLCTSKDTVNLLSGGAGDVTAISFVNGSQYDVRIDIAAAVIQAPAPAPAPPP